MDAARMATGPFKPPPSRALELMPQHPACVAAATIAAAMAVGSPHLATRTMTDGRATFLHCFSGDDVVQWLRKTRHAETDTDAQQLGQALLDAGVITCLFSGSDVFCEGHDMYRFCAPLEARLVEHNSSQADQANLSDSPLYSEDEISVGAETQQQEDTASGESDSDSVTVADNESESASLDNVIGDGADDKEASAGASVTAAVALAQPACLLRRGPSHDRLLALQELAAAQRMAETVVVAPPAVPVCSILRLRPAPPVPATKTRRRRLKFRFKANRHYETFAVEEYERSSWFDMDSAMDEWEDEEDGERIRQLHVRWAHMEFGQPEGYLCPERIAFDRETARLGNLTRIAQEHARTTQEDITEHLLEYLDAADRLYNDVLCGKLTPGQAGGKMEAVDVEDTSSKTMTPKVAVTCPRHNPSPDWEAAQHHAAATAASATAEAMRAAQVEAVASPTGLLSDAAEGSTVVTAAASPVSSPSPLPAEAESDDEVSVGSSSSEGTRPVLQRGRWRLTMPRFARGRKSSAATDKQSPQLSPEESEQGSPKASAKTSPKASAKASPKSSREPSPTPETGSPEPSEPAHAPAGAPAMAPSVALIATPTVVHTAVPSAAPAAPEETLRPATPDRVTPTHNRPQRGKMLDSLIRRFEPTPAERPTTPPDENSGRGPRRGSAIRRSLRGLFGRRSDSYNLPCVPDTLPRMRRSTPTTTSISVREARLRFEARTAETDGSTEAQQDDGDAQWKRSLAGVGPTLAPPLRSNIRNNNAMPTAEACITVSNLNTEMPRPLVDDTSTSGCIASSAVPSDTVALGSVPTVSQLSLALRRPSKEHGSLVNLYRDLIEPGADADESKKSPLRRSSSVRLDADQPSLAKDTLRRTSSMRLDQRLRSAVIVPLAKLRVTAPFVLCNMGVDIMAKERHLSDEEFYTAMSCTRVEFYALPLWRQQQKKKIARIF